MLCSRWRSRQMSSPVPRCGFAYRSACARQKRHGAAPTFLNTSCGQQVDAALTEYLALTQVYKETSDAEEVEEPPKIGP